MASSPPCHLHAAPLLWTGRGAVLSWGPPARLQDFASLFLILLCRISLLVVDFLPRERHSTQHPGRNGASDFSLGGDALGGRGRRQCPQVRLKTEKKKEGMLSSGRWVLFSNNLQKYGLCITGKAHAIDATSPGGLKTLSLIWNTGGQHIPAEEAGLGAAAPDWSSRPASSTALGIRGPVPSLQNSNQGHETN